MKKIYFLVFLGLTYFVSPVKSQTNPGDVWIADTFSVDTFSIEYRLFLPANYDSTVKYPLILLFPGINWSDDYYFKDFDNAASNVSFADSLNQKNNPCIILVPGLLSYKFWWDPIVEIPLSGLMDYVEKNYSYDENRYYITGFSLGGFETYIGIHFLKGKFAAAIPMSSGYAYRDSVELFKDVPLWNFHGQKDQTNLVAESRVIMENYEKLGSKVIYTNSNYRKEINLSDDQIKNHILAHSNPFSTEYPDGGHDVWDEAYNTPLLQDWLFSKYLLKPGAIKLSNLNDANVYPTLNEAHSIQWNSEYPADSVEIWFSNNNGDSWELIQSKLNDGSFDWDVSKVEDCSLGKIRILLKNNLGFVYGIDESSKFAIDNAASNGTPVIKILNQEFIKIPTPGLDSINLQLLVADPEKDSVTINLFYSVDNGKSFRSLDIFKESTQIDTIYRKVNLDSLPKVLQMVLKAEISDNVSDMADSTLWFYNIKGTTSAKRDIENSNIQIYPNPFDNELTIQTIGNREYSVELTTITGRTVYQSEMVSNFHRINLSELSSGIYLVQMKSDNIVSVRKVIKK